ncbi:TPA: hypothetical protein DDW35_00715 [Candidatus Sumerlaeota bacterium]|jgi:uncharacterized membrane protein|nr:hypothetical protein [Candidatus Sumerlaeota bacterium]
MIPKKTDLPGWKWKGFIYWDKNDPRLVIWYQKQRGWGNDVTFNAAHFRAWILALALPLLFLLFTAGPVFILLALKQHYCH